NQGGADRATQCESHCRRRADSCEQTRHNRAGHRCLDACANTVRLKTLGNRALRSAMTSSDLQQRAARIKLLLMDCDGVLTDGRIWLFENGEEQKGFHTRDGLGIDLWHRAGLTSGIISGRSSTAVERRARALGMTYVWLGRSDKEQVFADTLSKARVTNEEVA